MTGGTAGAILLTSLPSIGGDLVTVRDLDAARRVLERNGFEVRSSGDRIVSAEQALGAALFAGNTNT